MEGMEKAVVIPIAARKAGLFYLVNAKLPCTTHWTMLVVTNGACKENSPRLAGKLIY